MAKKATPYAGPSTDLSANPEIIMTFLSWWFQRCNTGQIEIGWLDPGGYGLIHNRRFDLKDETIVYTICEVNRVPGQSVYFRASTVNTPDGAATHDINFVQAPGVWGDLDTPEQMQSAASVKTLIRPNASIITGRIPSLRAQTFFRAEAPLVNADMVRELNSGILALYGGDPAVVNPTRYMRLPGTISWPWKKDRTVPELTGLKIYPATERQTAYPVGLLMSQLPKPQGRSPAPQIPTAAPAAPQALQPAPAPATGPFGFPIHEAPTSRVSGLLGAIRADRNWHTSMVRLTAHWVGRGLSDQEILATAEHITLPGYTVEDTRQEMTKAINGARKKWGVISEDRTVGPEAPAEPFSQDIIDPWDTLAGRLEFPVEALPPALRDYVIDRAEVIGADVGALAWACLSACSAALDGRIRMRMKKHDLWSVPPPIWVALVGHSSSKKTPIFQAAWHPLERRQALLLKEYGEQMKAWQALPKDKRDEDAKPLPPLRFVTHDATMEKVQELLSHQDRGIGMLRDELAGFIGGLEKYSSGRGSAADRAFYLQAYNGGTHVVDRVGRGTVFVQNLLITLCGGIQPDRLAAFGNLTDDGMWQRFVPVITEPGGLGVDRPAGNATQEYEFLFDRLVDAQPQTVAEFANDAFAVREELEQELHQLELLSPMGTRFSSFVGKLIGIFGRLCLVLSYAKGGITPFIVTRETALAARTLVLHSIVPHAARVYMAMGEGAGNAEAMQSIAGFILTKRKDRLTSGALARDVRVCRGLKLGDIQAVVSPLVAGGWLVPEESHAGNAAWIVNPRVHDRFRERVALEEQRRLVRREMLHRTDEEDEQ